MSSDKHTWLEPINLRGGTVLPHRLMPGPMMGLMSPLFRRAVNELNLVDYWLTPFIGISTASPRLSIFKKKLKHYLDSKKPFIVQLLGNNPNVLATATKQLSQLKIAGININFACPSSTVLSSNSGAKLLSQPDHMLKIIDSIRKECPNISISLKLRIGLSSPDEIESIIPRLNDSGIDFIMLHFRTATEKYKPVNDGAERIKKAVKLASSVPIIASGDIFSLDKAEQMYHTSNCHGITVARGLFEDPFLIRRIEAKLSNNHLDLQGDSKIVFSQTLSNVACKYPELYNRSNFLGLIRSIWGSKHDHFNNIKILPKEKITSYFEHICSDN